MGEALDNPWEGAKGAGKSAINIVPETGEMVMKAPLVQQASYFDTVSTLLDLCGQSEAAQGATLYCNLEPCGYDLETGERITSAMSGREGCATYCGTQYALIHRGQSRRLAMWDFNTGRVTSWYNLRPSCWLSTVAGEGMVLSPEGGGGCSCGNWLETSLVFAPKERTADVGAGKSSRPTRSGE